MKAKKRLSWPYEEIEGSYMPAIPVIFKGPKTHLHFIWQVKIPIDTGYRGFILITEADYNRLDLQLSELPVRYWPQIKTSSGEDVTLRRALASVEIPNTNIKLEGYLDTYKGNKKRLIGLKFLSNIRLILDGPEQETIIIQ